ncbi:MAG: hypothetical protein WA828_10050 [Coleofasciculaceae cyanobacterium]
MNSLSLKNVSLLLGIAVTIASNSLPVGAETPLKPSELASTPVLEVAPVATAANPVVNNSTTSLVAPNATGAAIIKQLDAPVSNTAVEIPVPPAALAQTQSESQASLDVPNSTAAVEISVPPALAQTQSEPEVAVTPPEKLETSAAYLAAQPNSSFGSTVPVQETNTAVAQNTEIIPGRATRGGSSYIGIGGNLGLGGGAALGDGAFMINSKIGLTRNISFRPAVLFADDVDFLLPVTYDFVLESADPFAPIPFAPYVGGGVIVSTNGDNTLGFLLTGGVDVPLSAQFVANAAISVGFRDDTDVGLMLGVGYTFPGFSR